MGNIIINVAEFECESPILGNTYRQGSNYIFNWETKGALYESYGLNVSLRLFYIGDENPPEVEYTAQPIPYIANSFTIEPPSFDTTSFRLLFSVDGGDTCSYSIEIPYSSIIIT